MDDAEYYAKMRREKNPPLRRSDVAFGTARGNFKTLKNASSGSQSPFPPYQKWQGREDAEMLEEKQSVNGLSSDE